MQSRWRSQTPLFPCRWDRIVQRPLLRIIQREARPPNARGRLSLNRTLTPGVGLFLVYPYFSGFRMLIPHPHRQLLDVKQNPLPPANRLGASPLPEKKEKSTHNPLKKKSQKKEKKRKNSEE